MTTGFIDFEIVGDAAGVQAMLSHLDSALSPVAMAGFLGVEIGSYLKERARNRFESEGDDVTGKWAPLMDSTVRVRETGPWNISGEHPINKRTGELEEYITGSDIFAWAHSMGATVRYPGRVTNKRSIRAKMETAQRGKANPKTPARPVLGMNERDLAFVITELAFHVQGYKGGVRVP